MCVCVCVCVCGCTYVNICLYVCILCHILSTYCACYMDVEI